MFKRSLCLAALVALTGGCHAATEGWQSLYRLEKRQFTYQGLEVTITSVRLGQQGVRMGVSDAAWQDMVQTQRGACHLGVRLRNQSNRPLVVLPQGFNLLDSKFALDRVTGSVGKLGGDPDHVRPLQPGDSQAAELSFEYDETARPNRLLLEALTRSTEGRTRRITGSIDLTAL